MSTRTIARVGHEGHRVERSEEFDAYYCHDCDVWLETRCRDPKCTYCVERPERPSNP